MNEIEIKNEFISKHQCNTCLSVGRTLKPLGKYSNIFRKIVSDCPLSSHWPDNIDKEILLCWECESMLKTAQKFLKNVQKADGLLQLGQEYVKTTLSNLTTILLNDTHSNIIYMRDKNESKNDGDIKCENMPEISDHDSFDAQITEVKSENVEINELKRKSKWALKRAEKNKKPKFKIIENNVSECYNIVKMDADEVEQILNTKQLKNECLKSEFVCTNCSCCFKMRKLLNKHVKKCQLESVNFICDICKKRFFDKRHLSAHIQKHYNKYSCVLCSYVSYEEKSMRTHARKQHKRVVECNKCRLKFGNQRIFFKHTKEWHEKYICDHCGVSFKMRYSIKDHIRKQHSPFECKPCNKRFARYGGLWLHNKTRHTTPTVEAYCVECDKTYVDEIRYKWHLNNSAKHRQGRAKRKIPCPDCDKVYTKNIYMKNHYDMVHLKNFKNRCEQCNKSFIRQSDLVKHRRRIHEGILPPRDKICYICGRGFTTRRILSQHVRTHTGECPFTQRQGTCRR